MKSYTILLLTLITLLLSACQEVIEIDLNSSNPVVVVEGNITLGENANIQLSYTSNYFNTDAPQNIENATVTLTNSNGESELLTNSGNGIYVGKNLIGEANTSYQLKVKLPEVELIGRTGILSEIELISMEFKESSFDLPNRPGGNNFGELSKMYSIQISFSDDPEQENFYLFKIKQNQRNFQFGNLMLTDQFSQKTGIITFSPMMYQFQALDTVNIKIYSMDKETYSFYNQLADISGEGIRGGMAGMSTPYNPVSNMGYNVLGYFAAWSLIDTTFIFMPTE